MRLPIHDLANLWTLTFNSMKDQNIGRIREALKETLNQVQLQDGDIKMRIRYGVVLLTNTEYYKIKYGIELTSANKTIELARSASLNIPRVLILTSSTWTRP